MPPPDRERDETMRGSAANHIHHRPAIVRRGGDIEKHQLVRFLGIVGHRCLHRIAGVNQIHEVDTFDDTAVGDVQTGDDSFGKHGGNEASNRQHAKHKQDFPHQLHSRIDFRHPLVWKKLPTATD